VQWEWGGTKTALAWPIFGEEPLAIIGFLPGFKVNNFQGHKLQKNNASHQLTNLKGGAKKWARGYPTH